MDEKQKLSQPITDYDKPVAYDAQGRPLYAHPPRLISRLKAELQTHAVRMMRPMVSDPVSNDEDINSKHERSKAMWPNLSLSENEYVIRMIPRHLIGLTGPLALGIFLITLSFFALFNYDLIVKTLQTQQNTIDPQFIILTVIAFICLVVVSTYVVYYIYANNKLFLTNESVIQEIQTGIFSKKEQIVSLVNVEDVSYTQDGIIQQIFDYGSIRLSTEGDETTYTFIYAANPKDHIKVLNNAVESFKNGRKVDGR